MNIYQPVISGSLTVTGSTTFFGNITINSGSLTMTSGSLSGTASFSTSASYAYTASSATSASYVLNAVSSSYAFTASSATNSTSASKAVSSSYSDTASFSNNFTVLGNLTVYGTQSVQYITSSQLNVANNIINVNVGTPGVRFGGLSVFDSGSTAGATGSLFWDSQNNNWVYQQVTGSTYTGGMLISGPRNTGGLGNEQGTTSGSLMKGQGGDHMTSSAIFEDGYKATVYTNALVVSSSGLVGIGTTNPNTVLDISTATAPSVLITMTGDPTAQGTMGAIRFVGKRSTYGTSYLTSIEGYQDGGTGDYNGLRFITSAGSQIERMRITSDGKVGIGTTSPVSTQGGLDISSGGISLVLGSDSGAATRTNATSKVARIASYQYTNANTPSAMMIAVNDGTDNALWIGGGSGLLNSATYISFYTTGSGVNTLVGKERMMITSGGNIGIGTSIPSASLHVAVTGQGGLLTQDILTVQGGGSPSGNYGFMCKAFNGDKLFYTDHLTYNVIMGLSGGKVGIGTTSPSTLLYAKTTGDGYNMLTIESTAGDAGIALKGGTAGSSVGGWTIQSQYGGNMVIVDRSSTPGTRVSIQPSGNLVLSRTTYSSIQAIGCYDDTSAGARSLSITSGGSIVAVASSLRYKKDVETLDPTTSESIYKMRPVWYRSTSRHDKEDWSWYGLIAEELAEIEPRLVQWGYKREDYGTNPETGEQELKEGAELQADGVQYERLTVLLISEMQKQNKAIQELKAEIEELKNK